MKLTLLQENLNSALTTVSHFSPTRPTLTGFRKYSLATEKATQKFRATNLKWGLIILWG